MNKIPILLLTGFLGSGKTSLLNHILKENEGLKIGVIVNDFGAINVDSLLVAKATEDKLELSNGCICCSLEDSALDDALGQLAHPGSMIEYIVIEASGLAEPRELANMLKRMGNKYARLDTVAAVVDAENVLETSEKHPEFFSQLDSADILIVNKVDRVSAKILKKVDGYLKFINSDARILHSEYGAVDTRLLLDVGTSKAHAEKGEQLALHDHEEHNHAHTHEKFNHVSFSSKKPLDPKAFELLMSHLPDSVYRAKGFVYFGMKGLEQKFTLQLVGRSHSLFAEDWRGAVPETKIVFIGTDIDEQKLLADLNELIDKTPDDIAGNLLDLNLYR